MLFTATPTITLVMTVFVVANVPKTIIVPAPMLETSKRAI